MTERAGCRIGHVPGAAVVDHGSPGQRAIGAARCLRTHEIGRRPTSRARTGDGSDPPRPDDPRSHSSVALGLSWADPHSCDLAGQVDHLLSPARDGRHESMTWSREPWKARGRRARSAGPPTPPSGARPPPADAVHRSWPAGSQAVAPSSARAESRQVRDPVCRHVIGSPCTVRSGRGCRILKLLAAQHNDHPCRQGQRCRDSRRDD